ncbi:DUF4292 domain-containing protein [bacterium]|nr:DUF4292 domain-containing protein [bacterium]
MELNRDQLLDSLISKENSLETLKTRCRVELHGQDQRENFTIDLVFKKPYRVKGVIKGILGSSAASLVSTADSTIVYVPSENRVYMDSYREETYNSILGLHFRFPEVMEALMGIFQFENKRGYLVDFKSTGETYQLVMEEGGEREIYAINPGSWTVVSYQRFSADLKAMLDIGYEDYYLAGEHWRPGIVRITNPMRGEWIEVQFDKQKVNRAVDPKVFDLEIPEGVEYMELY